MILHGRDAILRVHAKWLIFNRILRLGADVKYHVPTGFFAEGERFILLAMPPPSLERATLVMWYG